MPWLFFMYRFIIVGVGGTGSSFAKELVRFLSALKKPVATVTLIDGDVVEEKNLARQSFQMEDVGRNKAVALAEALTEVFNFPVKAYPSYITDSSQLLPLVTGCDDVPVIVGCVDNHRARQVMHRMFDVTVWKNIEWHNAPERLYYFDAANEFSSGEVVFSSFSLRSTGKRELTVVAPPRAAYFPEVLTDNSPDRTEISCEELNSVSPQHIAANIMAANQLLIASCGLVLTGVAPEGIVYFDISTFSSIFHDAKEVVEWKKQKK